MGPQFDRSARTTAAIYDPATDTWRRTADPPFFTWRHTATILPTGSVLIVGPYTETMSAYSFDPEEELWSATGVMGSAGRNGLATGRLADGRVLVVGGQGYSATSSAELYDPISNLWTPTISPAGWYNIPLPFLGISATALPDGSLFVAGKEIYTLLPLTE